MRLASLPYEAGARLSDEVGEGGSYFGLALSHRIGLRMDLGGENCKWDETRYDVLVQVGILLSTGFCTVRRNGVQTTFKW